MNVGARFWLGRSVPKAAALQTSTKTSSESVRTVTRTSGAKMTHCIQPGSGLPALASSRGSLQSTPSARKETMSTVAPPKRKSHPGIGRSRIPPRP